MVTQGFNQQTWPYSYTKHFKVYTQGMDGTFAIFYGQTTILLPKYLQDFEGCKIYNSLWKGLPTYVARTVLFVFFHTQTRKNTLQAVWCFNPPFFFLIMMASLRPHHRWLSLYVFSPEHDFVSPWHGRWCPPTYKLVCKPNELRLDLPSKPNLYWLSSILANLFGH